MAGHYENSWIFLQDSSSVLYRSKGHCCLCVIAVIGSLTGSLVMAIGACILLNYSMLDSSNVPDNLMYYKYSPLIGFTLSCFGLFCLVVAVTIGILVLFLEKPDSIQEDSFQYIRIPTEDLENSITPSE